MYTCSKPFLWARFSLSILCILFSQYLNILNLNFWYFCFVLFCFKTFTQFITKNFLWFIKMSQHVKVTAMFSCLNILLIVWICQNPCHWPVILSECSDSGQSSDSLWEMCIHGGQRNTGNPLHFPRGVSVVMLKSKKYKCFISFDSLKVWISMELQGNKLHFKFFLKQWHYSRKIALYQMNWEKGIIQYMYRIWLFKSWSFLH